MTTEELKNLIKREIDMMCYYLQEGETILVDEVQDCLLMNCGVEVDADTTPEAFAYIKQYLKELNVFEESNL